MTCEKKVTGKVSKDIFKLETAIKNFGTYKHSKESIKYFYYLLFNELLKIEEIGLFKKIIDYAFERDYCVSIFNYHNSTIKNMMKLEYDKERYIISSSNNNQMVLNNLNTKKKIDFKTKDNATSFLYFKDNLLTNSDKNRLSSINIKKGIKKCIFDIGSSGGIVEIIRLHDDAFAFYTKNKINDKYTIFVGSIDSNNNYINYGCLENKNKISILKKYDDDTLISGSIDGIIKVWYLSEEEEMSEVYILNGHKGKIKTIEKLPNDDIISYSSDNTIRIWSYDDSIDTWNTTKVLDAKKFNIRSVIKIDKNIIASVKKDGTLDIWNIDENNKFENKISLYNNELSLLYKKSKLKKMIVDIIKVKENIIAVTDVLHNIKLWNLKNGLCLANLKGHYSKINSISSIDDNTLVTASDDKTVRQWDVRNIISCV